MGSEYDVAIVGAGPAGMIAMLRFAAAGFSVLGIERGAKPKKGAVRDLRSTAFLNPSLEVLSTAGLGSQIEEFSTPLEVMEIVDAAQSPPAATRFYAEEVHAPYFGRNIMNVDLLQILEKAIAKEARIALHYGAEIASHMQFSDYVAIRLQDGNEFKARLVVAADGRNSGIRKALGIKTTQKDYKQWAQVFCVTHEKPHENVSSEIHLTGGPFTTVPISEIEGAHASAIVWMDKEKDTQARAAMNDTEFNRALNQRSFGWRGKMQRVGAISAFPMVLMRAEKLHCHRFVLIGEAAHVVPPIGAQGLNMSLRDIESLVRAVETGALQNPAQLNSWARKRYTDIAIRERGIDALNQVSIAGFGQALTIREYGLRILDRTSPLKRGLMRLGLG